ncbi:MAG TPA: hypothetical protein VFV38_43155 [Ktedonobacteraceae bacterium]|nr:hypothetical protein [Ktedonobacteraceae bacterium]
MIKELKRERSVSIFVMAADSSEKGEKQVTQYSDSFRDNLETDSRAQTWFDQKLASLDPTMRDQLFDYFNQTGIDPSGLSEDEFNALVNSPQGDSSSGLSFGSSEPSFGAGPCSNCGGTRHYYSFSAGGEVPCSWCNGSGVKNKTRVDKRGSGYRIAKQTDFVYFYCLSFIRL